MPDEAEMAFQNIHNPIVRTNYTCSSLPLSIKDKMHLIEIDSIKDRLFELLKIMSRENQFLDMMQNIRMKTHEELDAQQRDYFLHQQIKNIQAELGDGSGNSDSDELTEKAKTKKWSAEVKKVFDKEMRKLATLNQQSADYSVQLNYLQTIVSLPWNEFTTDDLSLQRARRILDRDHYGMEKVKERILEYIAVLQLRGNLKEPHPLPLRTTGSGQDIARKEHRRGPEQEVRQGVARRTARRGRDPWSPPHLHRSHAGTNHPESAKGRDEQPCSSSTRSTR